jgi:nucleotide-binding universal stress UspA family protein
VLGSHGRRGVQRLVLGSVAERVLRRSATSVLIVRAAP